MKMYALHEFIVIVLHFGPNTAYNSHLLVPIYTAVSMPLFTRIVIRSPLKRPYEGPFKVIHSGPKVFTINRGGKLEKYRLTG